MGPPGDDHGAGASGSPSEARGFLDFLMTKLFLKYSLLRALGGI